MEEAYGSLDAEQRRITEVMFRGLTERGAGHDTRRPVHLGEIAGLATVQPAAVAAVVEVFRAPGRCFLVPPAGTPLTPESVLDITHEALIRQWDRLKQWTQDEAEQAELYQRLEAAARRYRHGEGALWIDPDLQIALQWRDEHRPTEHWAARYGGDFDQAMGFLEKSRKARDAEQEAKEQRRRKEIRLTRTVAVVSLAAFLVSAIFAAWAWYERRSAVAAEQQRTESLFDSGLTHAALLAPVEDPAEARAVLRETAELDQAIAAPRRHARNLLAGDVELLGGTAEQVYEGAGAALIDLALSPDGEQLVAAGERGTLVLFDTASGRLLRRRLEGHDPEAGKTGAVSAMLFDPDGSTLYSAGDDGRILRWAMPAGKRTGDPWQAPAAVWVLALSPDGKTLASGGQDNAITLWSTNEGKTTRTLKGRASSIADGNTLAYTPDGRLLSGGYKGEVGLWDPATGQEQVLARIHAARVNAGGESGRPLPGHRRDR